MWRRSWRSFERRNLRSQREMGFNFGHLLTVVNTHSYPSRGGDSMIYDTYLSIYDRILSIYLYTINLPISTPNIKLHQKSEYE